MKGAFSFKAFLAGLLALASVLLGGSHVSANALAEAPVQDNAQKVNALQGESTWVAMINGQDSIALIHVNNLLELNGINSAIGGSRGYGVWVDSEDAARAKQILINDASQNPYSLFMDDKSFDFAPAMITTVKLDLRIGKDGRIKTDPRNPYIERAAREVYIHNLFTATSYKENYAKSGGEYYPPRNWDIAKEIEIRKRRYLNSEGHWNVGYDFSVLLESSDSPGAFNRLRGNVWDEGKECQIWGSGGLRRPSASD